MRTTGRPASPNGASSFHLWWEPVPTRCSEVSVVLAVEALPAHRRLVFWALQVDVVADDGHHGGVHLGLQWNPAHPGLTAVNWGGYHRNGGVLVGSPSPLPSTPGDPNTRDLAWVADRRYRLSIRPAVRPGWWAGIVTDLDTFEEWTVRELHCEGDFLTRPVVWSEVFAHCDDPSVSVLWSDPLATSPGGAVRPERFRVSYQTEADGGCSNTTVVEAERGIRQVTAAARRIPHGGVVQVP